MRALVLLLLLLAGQASAATIKLKWANPSRNADSTDCMLTDSLGNSMGTPLLNLRGERVWGVNYKTNDTLYFGEIPTTRVGLVDSADFSIADTVRYGEIIMRAVKMNGKTSCLAAHYQFAIEAPPPPPPPSPPDTTGHGLKGEYYTYDRWTDFKQFLGTRTDTTIDFNWGAGSAWPGGPADYYSVRWTGTIAIPTAGTYVFYINARDGRRLWIDGVQIQNYWNDRSDETASSAQLTAGVHPIRIEYYQGYGNAWCTLSWSGYFSKQVIPKGALHP